MKRGRKSLLDNKLVLSDKVKDALYKLRDNEFNYTKTSKELGISRITLSQWHKKFGKVVYSANPEEEIVQEKEVIQWVVRKSTDIEEIDEEREKRYKGNLFKLKENIVKKLCAAVDQIEKLNVRDIELMTKTLTYIESISGGKLIGDSNNGNSNPIVQNNFLQIVTQKLQQKIQQNEKTDSGADGDSQESAG